MHNEITLIVGKLGCGKTTLARKAVQNFEKNILVITNFGQDFLGLPICENLSGIIEYDIAVFVNDDSTTNEIAIRYSYERGNGLLIVDEAHLYQDSEQLKKVIRYSRHKNLDIILISHSFFDFARLNRQLIHNVIVFQMTEPYELSYVERINSEVNPRNLQNYEFIVVQGQIPKWLSKKDLTFKEKICKLKLK
ncbi:ATP-binding protein [Flavobacterium sp.]|uniref:ATP-binding protein n=1 Tax=Flavobacterium sp. TaxID=239 RepID=UPI002B4B81E8|nr:ATP-binding protein [Flavobacterium sp.]HLF51514.1 ATP-binding protein [Flavobacterium sp.]